MCYANSLVHGSANIKKLQRLLYTAARTVLPHLSKLPSTSLLRELHWLPVHSGIIYKLACLAYNSLTTGQPGYLCSLMNYYTPSRTLRSTNQLLDCPRFFTEFGKKSFSYLAPTVWNDCLLIQDSPPPSIPFAPSRDSPLCIAYQCCPPSDCSASDSALLLTFVRLSNHYIIIIITEIEAQLLSNKLLLDVHHILHYTM